MLPIAAAAALLAPAAPAASGMRISGTIANGGCAAAQAVTVPGPATIQAAVSSTAASNLVYTEILGPAGDVVASGPYDAPFAGT